MGGLLAEIDPSAGGLVYHAITAEIPLDVAPKTLFCEVKGESGSELESKSKPLVSGSGSELWGLRWDEIFVDLSHGRGPARGLAGGQASRKTVGPTSI